MSKFLRWIRGDPNNDDQVDNYIWSKDLEEYHHGDFSMATVRGNATMEDYLQVDTSADALFFGVYDGHKGHQAAEHCAVHLLGKILGRIRSNGFVISEATLRQGVKDTEETFMRGYVEKSYGKMPWLGRVGSCCLFGFIWQDRLFIGNLGDSRVVLGRDEDHLALTRDHNCQDGGIRVEFPHDAMYNTIYYIRGAYRVKGYIKVTRSIGDAYLKKQPFIVRDAFPAFDDVIHFDALLSSDPDINSGLIVERNKFIVVASHGFWNFLSNFEAIDIVRRNPRNGIAAKLLKTALEVAASRKGHTYEELRANYKDSNNSRRDWHDDMSVIVIFFDKKRDFWRKKQVATFCHRGLGRLSNKSDFEEFLAAFEESFAAVASSSSADAS